MSQSITSRRFPSTGGAKPDPVAIFNEERRVRGNQNTQQAKLRRSAEAKAKREKDILAVAKEAKAEGFRVLGDRKGRNYAERVDRAIQRGEPIPLPAKGSSRDTFTKEILEGKTGTELRQVGFDISRKFGEEKRRKPRIGPTLPTITRDKPSFGLPSSKFLVDRVSVGNDVEDTGPRLRTTLAPQPEPEPTPSGLNLNALGGSSDEDAPTLVDRRRTGGGSGGMPTSGLTPDQQFDALVSQRSEGDIFAGGRVRNAGLASQRSAPVGVGSGLTESQRQRDAELIAQLEAEPRSSPRGRDSGAGTGLKTLKRAGTI